MDVRPADLADDADVRALWEISEAEAALRPYDDSTTWASFRGDVRAPRSDIEKTWLLAERDGVAVGAASVRMFLLDNPRLAELDVVVHPDHRRKGAGRALLGALEAIAAEHGRTSWSGGFTAPLDDGGAGLAFSVAHGYAEVTSEQVKSLDLDAAVPRWGHLDADVAAHLGDYRVETFAGVVPEPWRAGFRALAGAFLEEVPTGDLDLENMTWNEQRLVEHEQRMRDTGRDWLVAVAIAPDGEPVGFTELALQVENPGTCWVGGTLVAPAHRGHRLGLAVKLASHRLLRERTPQCRYVLTGNAGVNAPMNAVNAAMGYEVVERWIDVQKRV